MPSDRRDIAGSIIAQQSRLVNNVDLIAARRLQCQIQSVGHILSPHVSAELPRDDVSAVIVQDCAEIEPASTDNLEIGEVGLPAARQSPLAAMRGGAG